MGYLALAIISSALVSTVMRIGEDKIENNMGMFVTNYVICALLSRLFMGSQELFVIKQGMDTVIILGLLSGVLYLASFVLLQLNIRKNGVVLAATFMKLGVLIPTLMAIIIFREQPKLSQLLGVLLAVVAIIMIHFEKEDADVARFKFLLIILLVGSGFTDSMANIYDKVGSVALKDHYLFLTFASAGFCALILWLKERQKLCIWDVVMGICIGIPNYFSSRFLLLALHTVSAVIVYPVYSVVTIVVISIIGLALFGETLGRRKLYAIGVILAALVFLNI